MQSSNIAAPRRGYLVPLALIGCLFFIFGFITWANSQLIPYLRIACELSSAESYLVATAFFAAYFFMALPSSAILQRVGYKRGISLGLGIMAVGALLFIPAAGGRSYPLFLAGLFVIGTGLALLQTASNPYVAVLGPNKSAAQRISIMGICNKVAGIIAVFVFGRITLSNADALVESLKSMSPVQKAVELDALAGKVVGPYTIIAAVLGTLAVIFLFLRLPEIVEEESADDTAISRTRTSILQFPHLLLGALAIFFYVGAEVISYDTFAAFGQHLGFPLDKADQPWWRNAKNFASFTGYALLAGYALGIVAVPKLMSSQAALRFSCLLSLVFVILARHTEGYAAVASFAALGFSQAMMWPGIFSLALNGLGRFTKVGAALLVMGIVGGAVLPPLYGKYAEWRGDPQRAYAILAPCYLYILFYATRGYRIGLPAKAPVEMPESA